MMHSKYAALIFAAWSMALLAWCGSSTTVTTASIDGLSFSIPSTLQSIPLSAIKQSQNNIVAARKETSWSLVLSESTMPAGMDIATFSQQWEQHLKGQLMWYTAGSLTKQSFTCSGQNVTSYLHSFAHTATQDANKIDSYYNQLYFIHNGSIYILSLAQTTKKSIFNDIMTSLHCN